MTTIRPEVLDELLAGYERPEILLGEEGLFKKLKKALSMPNQFSSEVPA